MVLLLAPKTGRAGGGKAVLLTGFILGFIFYGALTLMRVVPRYREPPALSVGISLLISRCSRNVLAARVVELSLNGGFSDVCPGHHRRL